LRLKAESDFAVGKPSTDARRRPDRVATTHIALRPLFSQQQLAAGLIRPD
jgi:hypothetical protein